LLPLGPTTLGTFTVVFQSKTYGEVDDQKLKESTEQHEEQTHARGTEIHVFSLIAV
jgi:hypothetical protein